MLISAVVVASLNQYELVGCTDHNKSKKEVRVSQEQIADDGQQRWLLRLTTSQLSFD